MAGRRLAALVVVVSVAPVAGMVAPVPLGIAVASPALVLPYKPVAVAAPVLVVW